MPNEAISFNSEEKWLQESTRKEGPQEWGGSLEASRGSL